MKTISKNKARTVTFSGVEEGYAIIVERESYVLYGVRKWNKTVTSLTLDELRKIIALVEKSEAEREHDNPNILKCKCIQQRATN